MMITKVKLHNFKCFEDESFHLEPFTLLSGLNGMGKSTLIHALLLLRQNYNMGLLRSHERISLNGELVQIGNAKDLLYQYFKDNEVSIALTFDDLLSSEWRIDAGIDSDNLPLKSRHRQKDEIYKSFLFSNNFHYLTAERMGPRVYYETSNYKVINQNQLGIRGEFAVNYLAAFQADDIPLRALKHPNSTGFSLYEQLNAWLGEIRPGTRIDITSSPEMSLVGLGYQFIGGSDIGNKFRPTNVGFGLSYVLSLLVAILASGPGTLLIVENPEAHLHPQGQARIGYLLALAASNGIQVIVESHSDHILNGMRIAVREGELKASQSKLLFFSGKIEENKFKHIILYPELDDKGKIKFWPEGFFDQTEKDLSRLFSS